MLDTIRADFYRLFRAPGFYISQGILIFYITASILAQASGYVTITTETQAAQSAAQDRLAWTGIQTLQNFSTMASFLVYFLLALFVITIGYDLTRGTVKNLLTSGVSRAQFFVSKYVVFLLVSLLQFVAFYGFAFLTASLIHGPGAVNGHLLGTFLRTLALQYLFTQALFACGLLLLFLLFSNVAAVLAVVILPIVVGVVTILFPKLTWLSDFDFLSATAAAWILPNTDAFQVSLAALSLILLCLAAAYGYFRRRAI